MITGSFSIPVTDQMKLRLGSELVMLSLKKAILLLESFKGCPVDGQIEKMIMSSEKIIKGFFINYTSNSFAVV